MRRDVTLHSSLLPAALYAASSFMPDSSATCSVQYSIRLRLLWMGSASGFLSQASDSPQVTKGQEGESTLISLTRMRLAQQACRSE